MGLASIANIPEDDQSFAAWSFSHMAHHRDITRRIFEAYGVEIPLYQIDEFDPRNPGAWYDQHQQMHNSQNTVLRIAGNNLDDVDWTDANQRAAWVWLNFTEHQQAGAILGV